MHWRPRHRCAAKGTGPGQLTQIWRALTIRRLNLRMPMPFDYLIMGAGVIWLLSAIAVLTIVMAGRAQSKRLDELDDLHARGFLN